MQHLPNRHTHTRCDHTHNPDTAHLSMDSCYTCGSLHYTLTSEMRLPVFKAWWDSKQPVVENVQQLPHSPWWQSKGLWLSVWWLCTTLQYAEVISKIVLQLLDTIAEQKITHVYKINYLSTVQLLCMHAEWFSSVVLRRGEWTSKPKGQIFEECFWGVECNQDIDMWLTQMDIG